MSRDETLVIENVSDSLALEVQDRGRAPSTIPASYRPQELVAQILNLAAAGVPVADLKVIAEMEKDISGRQAAMDFNAAMAAFKAECPAILRLKTADIATRRGSGFAYTYADLPEIQRTVDPWLTKNGLSYAWDSEADTQKGLMKITCTLSHVNGHTKSSSVSLPTESPAAMSPQQKYGAAMTFGMRRTLASLLGVVIEDDRPDTPAVDPTPITDDQVTVIEDLITESRANRAKFLAHFEIESVAQLRAAQYDEAIEALNQVKAKRAEKKS